MPDINTRITDYNQTITQMVEKGLLDIWGRLGEYRDFLVVIGGQRSHRLSPGWYPGT